jgi:hypothetical protein
MLTLIERFALPLARRTPNTLTPDAAWPSLRGQLSFIDAPQTARRLADRTYDPKLHQGTRVQDEARCERLLRGVPKASGPAWAAQLIEHVATPDGFAGFLAAYDSDLSKDRSVLPGPLGVYETGTGSGAGNVDAEEFIRRLSTTYRPGSGDGAQARCDMPEKPPRWLARIPEAVLLAALVTTDGDAAFDADDLHIPARAGLAPAHRSDLEGVPSRGDREPRQPFAELFYAPSPRKSTHPPGGDESGLWQPREVVAGH